jgi:hypothetical protein
MVIPIGRIERLITNYDKTTCLAAYIQINGMKAYALFDSGSMTDAVGAVGTLSRAV